MTNEGFGYLVGCFHQDWDLGSDDGTPDGVLEVFIRSEVLETVAEVHADLVALLAAVETESEAEELLVRFDSSYRPAMQGKSSLAWLQSISTRLGRALSPR